MTKDSTPAVIRNITQKIVQEFEPEKVMLFGSWARGDGRQDGDIDLLVVKETQARRIEREVELRKKLFGNNFPPLDLLVYMPSEIAKRIELRDFFIKDILEKGVTLYVKQLMF